MVRLFVPLLLVVWVSPAIGAELVVPKLKGPGSKSCRSVITDLIDASHDLVDYEEFTGDVPRPSPKRLEVTSVWLRDRARDNPNVQVAILGAKRGKGKLRLDVFELPSGRLLGVKTYRVQRACRLTSRSRGLARRWLRQVIARAATAPSQVAVAAASPNTTVATAPPPKATAPKPAAPKPELTPPSATEASPAPRPAAPPPGSKPAPRPAAPPPRSKPAPAPLETEVVATADALPEVDGTPLIGASTDVVVAPDPVSSVARTGPRLFTVDVGLSLTGRTWRFVEPGSAALRDYEIGALAAPMARVGVHPLALAVPALAPLVVHASYRRSVGLESVRSERGSRHPTTLTDLELGVGYGFALDQGQVTIAPEVAYRGTSFAIRAADDGRLEPGLPSVDYRSLALGVGVEVPISSRFELWGRLRYLTLLSAGEQLRNATFFRGTSASGFDLAAHLAIAISGPVSVKIGAQFLQYFLSFDSEPDDARHASGARERMLTFDTGLRLAL